MFRAGNRQIIVRKLYKGEPGLQKSLVDLKDKKVLDFGCGNGAQTIQFSNTGASIMAVDINKNNLDIFREYISDNKISNIDILKYDGNIIPFENESFDIVVSYEVLEHVADEQKSLQEIHRVLKIGGDIVISVPNKWWIFETHGANLPLLKWNRVPFFSWLPYKIHNKFAKARIYRKRNIVKLLTNIGFNIKKQLYITAPMDMVKSERLNHVLRKYIFIDDTTDCTFLSTSLLIYGVKQKNDKYKRFR